MTARRVTPRKPRSARLKRWFETVGWYVLLVLFALITALPFLWTGLMSLRENSSNLFHRTSRRS